MPDSPNHDNLEARLRDYGAVLQSQLDAAPTGGAAASGSGAEDNSNVLFMGEFAPGSATTPRRSSIPKGAILSAAAAILVVFALVLPTVISTGASEPITVTGGVASESDGDPEGPDGDKDHADSLDENRRDADGTLIPAEDAEQEVEELAEGEKPADDEADWSGFSVQVGRDDDGEVASAAASDGGDTGDEDTANGNDDGDQDQGGSTGSAAATPGEDKDAEDQADDKSEEDKDAEDKDAEDKDGDQADRDKAESDDETCPAGAKERDGSCVKIGAPPVLGVGGCPTGAVSLGDDCYEVVPPTCGELAAAPDGDGCLKPVGATGGTSGCPGAYTQDGDLCVKLAEVSVTCDEGVPSGDACLIKQTPTGESAGCEAGLLAIGNQCYELVDPSFDCGEMTTLPNGNCRYSVEATGGTECPAGLEKWEDICYRYEEPPTFSCDVGELAEPGWCLSYVEGTPGPEVCDDGVSQDDLGCYVLYEPEEGSCGELTEFEGMCRKDKPSYPTWTCEDGKTVYDNQCKVWTEASASCAAGEPVEGNTKCKTIEQPISTTGCPDYAEQDAQGCFKVKEPSVSCGELHVAPDGENCKRWVSEAAGSGGTCNDGFELVGDYCKKYVDGTPGCSGAELVYDGGKPYCMYTKPVGNADSGCAEGTVEKAGTCYEIVPATCDGLDADIYGNGCKKPIATEGQYSCEAGYILDGDDCIKKLD